MTCEAKDSVELLADRVIELEQNLATANVVLEKTLSHLMNSHPEDAEAYLSLLQELQQVWD